MVGTGDEKAGSVDDEVARSEDELSDTDAVEIDGREGVAEEVAQEEMFEQPEASTNPKLVN